MDRVLTGIYNFLSLIEQNWTLILIILGIIVKLVDSTKKYLEKSKEEKIELAKEGVAEIITRLCMEAELEWEEYKKSGTVKRAQVYEKLFAKFPILLEVTDQAQLIDYIDNLIDNALVEVNRLVNDKITG